LYILAIVPTAGIIYIAAVSSATVECNVRNIILIDFFRIIRSVTIYVLEPHLKNHNVVKFYIVLTVYHVMILDK